MRNIALQQAWAKSRCLYWAYEFFLEKAATEDVKWMGMFVSPSNYVCQKPVGSLWPTGHSLMKDSYVTAYLGHWPRFWTHLEYVFFFHTKSSVKSIGLLQKIPENGNHASSRDNHCWHTGVFLSSVWMCCAWWRMCCWSMPVCCLVYLTSIAQVFLGCWTLSWTSSHREVWTARHHLTPTANDKLNTAPTKLAVYRWCGCYRLNLGVLPNSYAEIKFHKGEIWGSGLFGGWVGHEGGTPMSGISDTREPLTPPASEDITRWLRMRILPRNWSASALILDVQP